MERKNNSIKNRIPFRLPLRVYLSYLMVFTLIFTAVSFAKFATSGGSSDGARVAAFAVSTLHDSDSDEMSHTFDDTATGFNTRTSHSYVITARNFDDTAVSEVALSYTVIITVDGGLPEGISHTVDGRAPVSQLNGAYTFSGFSAFPPAVETTYENTLTVSAVSSDIPVDISNLSLDISVRFDQID